MLLLLHLLPKALGSKFRGNNRYYLITAAGWLQLEIDKQQICRNIRLNGDKVTVTLLNRVRLGMRTLARLSLAWQR